MEILSIIVTGKAKCWLFLLPKLNWLLIVGLIGNTTDCCSNAQTVCVVIFSYLWHLGSGIFTIFMIKLCVGFGTSSKHPKVQILLTAVAMHKESVCGILVASRGWNSHYIHDQILCGIWFGTSIEYPKVQIFIPTLVQCCLQLSEKVLGKSRKHSILG